MHELRNAPLCLICFLAPRSPLPWSGCEDLGVLSSHLILCESALLEQPSQINPAFAQSKGKRASSVQTLSCNGAQLTEILLPGRSSVTLAVWGENLHVCSPLWHKQKEGFYDIDPVKDGRPGSALLQVMWTWRHPRLARDWIIKKTEGKSAVLKVSRWGWNRLLKNYIFSSHHCSGRVSAETITRVRLKKGPHECRHLVLVIIFGLCAERWLCCLHVRLPITANDSINGEDVLHVLTIWCHVAPLY